MNVALLTDPLPQSHIVYPCADEHRIAEAVGTFAASGLRKGDAVVLVTTDRRRELIDRRLRADGLVLDALQDSGQLAFLNAETLLGTFMADGMPDAFLFRQRVGRIIEQARVHQGTPRKVRIFGEMVSLLYMESNTPAAARLEEFWNDMVAAHGISLFCAYSLKLATDKLPQALLDAHSHDLSSVSQ